MKEIYNEYAKDKIKELYGKLGNLYMEKLFRDMIFMPIPFDTDSESKYAEEVEAIRRKLNEFKGIID